MPPASTNHWMKLGRSPTIFWEPASRALPSHLVGQVTAQLLPDDKRAQVETKLVARAASNTVGYNGPATIHSSGMTDLAGAKRIVIDDKGFASYPAKATASDEDSDHGHQRRRQHGPTRGHQPGL